MVNDIWTSVKAYLYDRTSSPLLGALVTGWVAWNFKILMLFFSKADYAVKVWEIDYFYSQTFFVFRPYGLEHWLFSNYIFCVFIMPVTTAAFYIYVFPWFSHKVFNHSYQKQIDLNNKKKEMQGSELIDVDEKAEILGMYEQAKLETRELVVKHRQEMERIENQLSIVIQEKEEIRQQSEELLTNLREKEKEIEDNSPFSNVMDDGFIAARGNSSDVDADFEGKHSKEQQLDYINFYEELDWVEKSAVEHIVSIAQDNGPEIDELQSQLLNVSSDNEIANDSQALNKLLSKMKAFDIIGVDSSSLGKYYELAENGKPLYRYILGRSNDDKYPRPDNRNRDIAKEAVDKDVSFYFNVDEHTQARYKRILEGLFLEDRGKHEFGMQSNLFDAAMVQLILHGLVQQHNDIGKYRITQEGRSFYTNLNNVKAG